VLVQSFPATQLDTNCWVVAPDAGHSAYWEQPEVFNRAVLDFIRNPHYS